MTTERIARFKVGAKIGDDITVLGVVARDGWRPVYIGWHHRAWCPVACKVVRSTKRAEQEAVALSSVCHPNIVRTLGVIEPGVLIMEFLEGPRLSQLIAEEKLTLSDKLRIAVHIGGALAHIHDRGLLHMDLKPDNVIVANGRPVLFDLGTARPQGSKRPPLVTGTDPYIAPEECRLARATTASDVFSFGALLYHLFSGRLPFKPSTKRVPYPQLTDQATPLLSHTSRLPRELANAVMDCLVPLPQDRPSLTTILPVLNGQIRKGPAMWPAGFQPATTPKAAKAVSRAA